MIRRTFLDRLLSFLSALVFLPFSTFAQGNRYLTIVKNGRKSQAPFFEKFGRIYISLVDFAQSGDFGFYTNEDRRKTVLYAGRDKIKFTAGNSFIILNDRILQVLGEPVWREREIWIPADLLVSIFNDNTVHVMQFDAEKKIFSIGAKNVNIASIQISAKSNGTLLHIYTSKQFERKNVHLKLVNNWLYVEIFDAKLDVNSINQKVPSGLVSEIRAVQFDNSASIAFKLRKKIVARELVFDQDSSDLLVSLRTEEPLVDQQSEKQKLDNRKNDWKIHTIVIDPGHGGKDPGAVGYGRLYEKNIVLPVALKLGKEINKRLPGTKVVYTRKTDVFIPLYQRTKIANENNGKLFISLHCNSNDNKRARGFETFFLSADKDVRARDVVLKENESITFESKKEQKRYQDVNFVLATMAQNAFIKHSQYLATTVQKSMTRKLTSVDMKSRGVKQGAFWVMVGATMPNILVEMGFISNKHEARTLQRSTTQTKLASAICDGVVKYKRDIEGAM